MNFEYHRENSPYVHAASLSKRCLHTTKMKTLSFVAFKTTTVFLRVSSKHNTTPTILVTSSNAICEVSHVVPYVSTPMNWRYVWLQLFFSQMLISYLIRLLNRPPRFQKSQGIGAITIVQHDKVVVAQVTSKLWYICNANMGNAADKE